MSTKTLTFNTVTQNDVDSLMPIETACHSYPWSEKTFRSCIGDRYFGFYAKQGAQIVGFYIADFVAGEVTLMDICVSPDLQGKGYGKALLNHFNTQALERDAQSLFLEVRAKNISALMLYINDGFNEIGRRTGYYPSEIGYEDAIVMKKVL